MLYCEFLEGTGAPDNQHSYKEYKRIEKIYNADDTMEKQDAYAMYKPQFASVKEAKEIIKKEKEEKMTCYYGQDYSSNLPEYLEFKGMKEIFISNGFGEAEANFILACMVNAGCKFTI